MSEEANQNNSETGIGDEVRLYVEKRIQLLTIVIAEQVSRIIAESFQKLIGVLLIGGGFFFIWFALGYFISDLVNSTGLGFLIVSAPLLIAGYIFMKNKSEKLTAKIQAEMISKAMESVEQNLMANRRKREEELDEEEK
ncbi:MAG: phage holin family protein [Balneolaceae bacterium]|nr:phage holin family protein [Balneolaceae bacterium]MCH8549120.1 phage holin family protein [Balneolaceae bacterium]